MSESYQGGTAGTPGVDPQQPSGRVETAKQEVAGVTGTAKEEAGTVVQTAKSEAGAVAHEAKSQVKDLYHQTRTQLMDQAGQQQQRVAEGLRSVSGELSSMADTSQGGVAADVVRQVSTRVEGVAGWIGDRDPGSLLQEVKSYARRKPGTFIAVAAVAGLVVGRLTRALADSAAEHSGDSTGGSSSGSSVSGASSGSTMSGSGSQGGANVTVAGGSGAAAGTAGAAGIPGEAWPPAPGAAGTTAGGADDTPLYDRTDAAAREQFGEDRP